MPSNNQTPDAPGVSPPLPELAYTLVDNAEGLTMVQAVLNCLPGPVALDTETTGLNFRRHRVRLIQLAIGPYVFVLDLFALDCAAPLWPALASKELVIFNAAFDLA